MRNVCLLPFILACLELVGYRANAQSKRTSVPTAVSPVSVPPVHQKVNSLHPKGMQSLPFPSMIYPANGATNVPLVPKFLFQTVVGGARYDIEIATDQYFYNVVQTDYWIFSPPTDSVFLLRFDPSVSGPTAYTNNTLYYWRVEVTDSAGNSSGWSTPFSYTTTSAGVAVSQPTLSLPSNYDTVPWIGTTFYWLPSSGATQYQVQWSTSSIFYGYNYHWSNGNQTSLVGNLKPNTTYYWRVIAYNDGTISQFSPAGVFYTGSIDTLTATSGSFDDGSGTDNYADGLDVRWLIAPPSAKQIVLSFSSFNTEANYDFVTVYDGSNINAPVLGQFSGNTPPAQITSSGGTMLVRFTSDFATNEQGWTANYYSVSRSDVISGKVLNLAFNPWTGDSSMTPLAQAQVSFYKGTSLIGTVTSGTDAGFSLAGLDSNQLYRVVVNANGTDPITQQQITLRYADTVRTNSNNLTFMVPLSLYQTKYGLIDSLEQPTIDLTSAGVDPGYTPVQISGYDESGTQRLLGQFASMNTQITNGALSSLIRLTMSEQMTNNYFQDASILTVESLRSLYPFVQTLIGIGSMASAITTGTTGIISKVFGSIFDLQKEHTQLILNSAFARLPSQRSQQLNGVTTLFLSALGVTALPAHGAIDVLVRDQAFPFGVRLYMRDYYLPETQRYLDLSVASSAMYNYTGAEAGAFSMSNAFYQQSHALTLETVSYASQLRNSSSLLKTGAELLGLASIISSPTVVPAAVLSAAATICGGISIGTVGAALYEDYSRLASIPFDLSSTVNAVYNPILSRTYRVLGTKKTYGRMKDLDAIGSAMRVASGNYNDALSNFLEQVNSGNRSAAISVIPTIMNLDSALNSQTRFSTYAINASFPIADSTVSGFDSLYSSTNHDISVSFATRQATYLNILAYLMDSTTTTYADSINEYGQTAIAANNQMNSSINQAFNAVQAVGAPGYVASTSTQAPASVVVGSSFTIKVNFQNFGGTVANGLYANLLLTGGFKTDEDSMFVGELQPGATDSVVFSVTAPDADTTGSYSLLFVSSDASSSPASGTLRSVAATGVGDIVPSVPKNYALHQNYPNPFNPSTIIEYAVPNKVHVILIVYDVLGRTVETLVDEKEAPGTYKVLFDASCLPSGVYFYRIFAGHFVETKKCLVIK